MITKSIKENTALLIVTADGTFSYHSLQIQLCCSNLISLLSMPVFGIEAFAAKFRCVNSPPKRNARKDFVK
jgi:hypothetical protein